MRLNPFLLENLMKENIEVGRVSGFLRKKFFVHASGKCGQFLIPLEVVLKICDAVFECPYFGFLFPDFVGKFIETAFSNAFFHISVNQLF
ncbi:hypothetical protein SDC9_152973 [bioreactor metagenome]|uniref:Uncharacterized protein n=1 Tax=bioreactor metagenome TaxID=1076179 RepID=A0A645EWB0_9ZZZZ